MEPELPESSFIKPPYKVEGTPKEARASFYEFAKDRIKYLNEEEFRKWQKENRKKPNFITTASLVIGFSTREGDNFNKWIDNLEIIINKEGFNVYGKDYSDILPFVLEHEIYEAWLIGKKGVASELSDHKQHLLARRREYLLAEQAGLGDKMLEYATKVNPADKEEYEYALKAAKKQLGHKK